VPQKKIEIIIGGDASGANRAFQSATGGSSKMRSAVLKVGAAVGAAFAVDKVVDFARSAISSASNLNETVSKSRAVFGEASAGLERWASGAAKSIGQSKQQALEAAGTFGNMFTQLGLDGTHAAVVSQQMTILASDFASFHNADISEVIAAQTAAFRGEYDAVQRFVPTINAAAVEQKALAMTGKATAKELTNQEKALATNALLMEGAGKAAGDFARTSDGLANKQRIQSARWADMQAKIGSGLLPVMTALTGFAINTLIPTIEKISKFVGDNKELFAALALGIAVAVGAFIGPAFVTWAAGAAAAAAATVLAALPVIALGAVVAGVAFLIIKHWDTVKGAFMAVFNWVRSNWPLLLAIITGPIGIAVLVITRNIDTIKNVIGSVVGWVRETFDAVVGFVTGMPGRISSAARGMFDGIKDAFKGAINWVIGKWNDLSFKIGGQKVFGKTLPSVTIDTPNIPEFRAQGGPVSAWKPYIVGERGPELWVPRSSGSIVPNHQLGGNGVHIENLNITQTDPDVTTIGRGVLWAVEVA
jgi:hypothetical protein